MKFHARTGLETGSDQEKQTEEATVKIETVIEGGEGRNEHSAEEHTGNHVKKYGGYRFCERKSS